MFEDYEKSESTSQIYGRGTAEYVVSMPKEVIATESVCLRVQKSLLRQDLFFEDVNPGWFVRDFLMC